MCANLSAPQFLKLERYAQSLSHRVCMGDGGSVWWAPVGTRPCSEDFFRVLRFSSLHQKQHCKFQFDPEMRGTGLSTLLFVLPSLNKVNLFIWFIYFIRYIGKIWDGRRKIKSPIVSDTWCWSLSCFSLFLCIRQLRPHYVRLLKLGYPAEMTRE